MREQAETQWKKFGSPPIGEEAEVPDAHEAAWQHVEQEAAEELVARQSHDSLTVVVRGIAPSESDFAISKSKQPVVGVGDGNAVSVVAEIAQDVFRFTEGRIGIDHPVLAEQHSEPGCEGLRIGKRRECDGLQYFFVLPVDPPATVLNEGRSCMANNIGHLQRRPVHALGICSPC
jgi:hypothetical protein